ncbi:MAG TPA: hypothetical protein VMR06_01515 [Dokdonella sp.]|uniref:hypothetical protein n=1 Tax=Dokdonella sp. TaxID=2291710 RepID=UPI002BB0F983|nr:hypothetical protein [Dokdonella sp.]HUD40654.1 hypothetical protein [Dokdonella sp.]
MKSTAVRYVAATAVLLAVSACGHDATSTGGAPAAAPSTSAPSDPPASMSGLPAMPQRYSKNLTRAFTAASEGRSPTMACTSVIAMAAGNPLPEGRAPTPDSVRAFELCYIDVGARYIDTLLAQIRAGGAKDELCAKIASYAVIARTSLGSFAGNAGLDVAALDRRLLERVRAGMQTSCPDQIEALGGDR